MSRRTSYLMASVIAVSTFSMQALPVFAQETVVAEQNSIEIHTAQDFVNVYLSTVVEGEEGPSYTLFTTIDESNYLSVLAAQNYLQSLASDSTIDMTTQAILPKSEEQKAIDAQLKQEIEAYLETINYASMLESAQAIVAAQEQVEQPEVVEEEIVEEEQLEDVSDMLESEKRVVAAPRMLFARTLNTPTVEEKVEPSVEAKPEVKEEAKVEPKVELKEEVKAQAKEEAKVEAKVETKEETKQEAVQTPTVSNPKNTKSTSDTSEAQKFVQTYLTSSTGVVYAAGNTVNYQNILNSLSAWNKLTTAQQNEVNSILSTRANTSYAQLLQDAQTIKANGGTTQNTSYDYTAPYAHVNTGVHSNTSFYSLLCFVSLFVMGMITKRKKESASN